MSPIHKLIEQFNHIVMGQADQPLELHELKVEFVQKRRDIVRQLQLCHSSGGIVGVYSNTLGKGMFLVTVLQIVNERALVLRTVNAYGQFASKVFLDIDEIASIIPFNQVYNETDVDDDDLNTRSQLTMFPREN